MESLTLECVNHCRQLEYGPFEIILLPDEPSVLDNLDEAKVIPTGPVTPGRKRNVGASAARGEVLAYIDSDAYPRTDWLRNAVRHLQTSNVGAVGGPGLTPLSGDEFAQAQGRILSSFLVGKDIAARYSESMVKEVDDIHSVNFIAWRRVIESVGGWDEHYWPGEDTLMSLRIKKSGHKQLLATDVIVYHHRRKTWRNYLAQIWNYGLHRGYFAKHFPENSRRLKYFSPSMFLASLVLIPVLALAWGFLWLVYSAGIATYLLSVGFVSFRNGFRRSAMIFIGIPLTHIVYGAAFLDGLTSRGLKR